MHNTTLQVLLCGVSHFLIFMLNVIMLSIVMLNVVMLNVFFAKCRYAECRYAECHYAGCRGAQPTFAEYLNSKRQLKLKESLSL
jgi:hypothetical protein